MSNELIDNLIDCEIVDDDAIQTQVEDDDTINTGSLDNVIVALKSYTGKESDTINVIVDNDDCTIQADLKNPRQYIKEYTEMPEPSSDYDGDIAQFKGETNNKYINGYFYECKEVTTSTSPITIPESLVVEQIAGYNLGNITVDKDEYIAGITTKGYEYGISDEDELTFEFVGFPQTAKLADGVEDVYITRDIDGDENGAYAWTVDGTETTLYVDTQWLDYDTYFYGTSDFQAKTALSFSEILTYNTMQNGYWVCDNWYYPEEFSESNKVDLADFGISYDGTALVGAKFYTKYTYEVEATEEETTTTYEWVNIKVQDNNVKYDTTANWDIQTTFVPNKGEIIVYSDYKKDGDKDVAGIKIGDGNAYVVDLPFVTGYLEKQILSNISALSEHINDTNLHIQSGEREFWNNKLNLDIEDDVLSFNRN